MQTMSTPFQPVGDNLVDLAGQLQPVGLIEALPPPQVLDISDDAQPGTDPPGDDPLDSALGLVSQLPAEAREATSTSMSLTETDTNNTPEIDTDTNPAIDYTALSYPLILEHPGPRALQEEVSG